MKTSESIYTGLEQYDHRDKAFIEKEWNHHNQEGEDPSTESPLPPEIKILDIDKHLSKLAQSALDSGRNNLVIVDIGSGQSGNFVFSFSDLRSNYPELTKFLTKHKGFNLRIIGVTGTQRDQIDGQQIKNEEKTVSEDNKVRIENYAYTITRAHNLDTLLKRIIGSGMTDEQWIEAKKSGCVDAFFSTWALGYFTPANFEELIENSSLLLFPKGTIHGTIYDEIPPGFEKSEYGFYPSLRIRNKDHFLAQSEFGAANLEPSKRHDIFKKQIRMLLKNKLITIPELQNQIKNGVYRNEKFPESQQLVTQFKALPFLNDPSINEEEFLEEINNLPKNIFDERIRTFHLFVSLYTTIERLIRERAEVKSRERKTQVLEKIKSNDNYRTFYNTRTFYIEKQKQPI